MPVLYIDPVMGLLAMQLHFLFVCLFYIITNSMVFFYMSKQRTYTCHCHFFLYICASALLKLVVPLSKRPATATPAVGDFNDLCYFLLTHSDGLMD